MPISQNKLMPYSDNPSEIEESGTEPRKSRGTTTRKNRPSSRFKGRKFFQKWIMSSRRLKLPGQQHATHLRPNGSTNDPSGLPIKIRPVSFLFTHLDQHHNTGDPWFQSDKPCHPSYTQKTFSLFWIHNNYQPVLLNTGHRGFIESDLVLELFQ
ncbi:hypothetical protein H4Q26_016871 [Puccinia striiformis f. sp. tritici PST-130]|nr:hypothetical protein H4Q26_016871 [Puccinia striiformis f. sp. tritici PST-130]